MIATAGHVYCNHIERNLFTDAMAEPSKANAKACL